MNNGTIIRPRHQPLSLLLVVGLLSACAPAVRPSVKIGLVAPFVGHYREVGEEVVTAVRLAIREANVAGGPAGYSVELMAYDDEGDPTQAKEQARKLATDPTVVGVIGDWLETTTMAAAPVYAGAQIPYLATAASADLDPAAFRIWYTAQTYAATGSGSPVCALPCDPFGENAADGKARVTPAVWGLNLLPRLLPEAAQQIKVLTPAPLPADSTDPGFAERYKSISSGVQPRYLAVLAYDATRLLLTAIADEVKANGAPTRAGVAAALARVHYNGLSGPISFDGEHDWRGAKSWVYVWRAGVLVKP